MYKMNRSAHTNENFIDAIQIFREHEIFVWLDQGALLGVIRDKKLLPWDPDIDISIWEEDFDKVVAIRKKFEDIGFFVEIHEYKDGMWFSRGEGKHIELAKQKREGDFVIRRNAQPRNSKLDLFIKSVISRLPKPVFFQLRKFGRKYFSKPPVIFKAPSFYFENFSQIDFLGEKVNIPERYEEYLEFKYGKEWNIPKKKWDFSKEDGAVKYNMRNDNEDMQSPSKMD
jgi:lipopolysaccharide cholinephosphotransferase